MRGQISILSIQIFKKPAPNLGREPINLPGGRLARVRYAPIATKFRSAAKCPELGANRKWLAHGQNDAIDARWQAYSRCCGSVMASRF